MLFWTIAVRDIQKNRYFLLQIANMEKMQYIYMHYHFENCQLEKKERNSYFLHWNFDWKICFVVFFLEWNEWKTPQFNFSSQNLSIERNFFKWDGKETKILRLLFHRIWKRFLFDWFYSPPHVEFFEMRGDSDDQIFLAQVWSHWQEKSQFRPNGRQGSLGRPRSLREPFGSLRSYCPERGH